MPSEFDAQLAEIDKQEWAKVPEEMPDFPDQSYLLQVRNCEMRRAKNEKQTLMVVVSWLIIDGSEYDGMVIPTRYFPQSLPYGAMFTKQFVRGVGFEPPADPNDLPDIADKIHEAAPQVKASVTSTANEAFGGRNYTVAIKALLGAGERVKREDTEKPAATNRSVGVTEKISVGARVAFKDNDGDEQQGDVKSIKGKTATVAVDDDPEVWEVSVVKLSLVEAEAVEPEGEPEAEGDDLDGLDRSALRKLITAEDLGIKTYKSWDEDKIREEIRNARPEPEATEEPEPAEEPEPVEDPAEEPEVAEEPEPSGEGDRLSLDDLVAVGLAHGIKIADADTNDAVMAKLLARTWDKAKLTEAEYDMLYGIGCKFGTPAPRARGSVTRKAGKKGAKKKTAKKRGKR